MRRVADKKYAPLPELYQKRDGSLGADRWLTTEETADTIVGHGATTRDIRRMITIFGVPVQKHGGFLWIRVSDAWAMADTVEHYGLPPFWE